MATVSIHPLLIIAGVIIIAGGAIFAIKLVRSSKPAPIPEPKPEESDSEQRSSPSTVDKRIIEEVKPMIKHLSGSMNALQGIVEGEDTETADVVFVNLSQIIESHGSDMLKSWFSSFSDDRKQWDLTLYKDKAAKMFQILIWCGIKRFDETKYKWDDISALRYRRLSKIDVGETFEVLTPCWYYDGLIFEQGFVRAKQ